MYTIYMYIYIYSKHNSLSRAFITTHSPRPLCVPETNDNIYLYIMGATDRVIIRRINGFRNRGRIVGRNKTFDYYDYILHAK